MVRLPAIPLGKVQVLAEIPRSEEIIELPEGTHMKSLSAYEVSRDHAVVFSSRENPWAIRNPLDEARDLYRMVAYGSCTVESIRELISVPPEIESALRLYAEQFPRDGQRIHCVLRFREKVAQEFERLVDQNLSPIGDASHPHVSAAVGELGVEMDAAG
jgi:hypothetical protein